MSMPDSWDSNDGQTQHLDEHGNTVGAQIGVRGELIAGNGLGIYWAARALEHPEDGVKPTHLAIPLDAESLAGLRERIAIAILENVGDGSQSAADAVLAALGLEQA